MERWLKDEVAKQRKDLTPAYQRPGCVTFRSNERPFDARDVVHAVFARMWAASLGLAADPDAVHRLVKEHGGRVHVAVSNGNGTGGARFVVTLPIDVPRASPR